MILPLRGLSIIAGICVAAAWPVWAFAGEAPPAPAADKPAGPAEARSAVAVDEKVRAVAIPATVAKQGTYDVLKGAIEYVLVAKGGKEYETLFVTPVSAQDLHDALRKIGLRPGRPAIGDDPPKGQPANLLVEYQDAGKTVRKPADAFLAYLKTDRPVEPAPWPFTGSTRAVDPQAGTDALAASQTRSLVGLHYDDTSPLFQNPRSECRESNIYKANTKALPPAGTAVRFIFERPAVKVPEGWRRAHVLVGGRVQGVGFRDFVQNQARRLKVVGFVKNLADGRVEAVMEGPGAAVAELVEQMKRGPRSARVESADVKDEPPQGEFDAFDVVVEDH